MAKKKKRSGGGGGGAQQQENAAEDRDDDKACADDADQGSDAGKDKGKDKPAAGDEEKDKDKGCGGGGGGKDKDDKAKAKDKEKKAPPPPPVATAVLKVDMHCDGCARRIRASVRRYPGVEGVAMEVDKGSMTVVGRFDAKKLRDRVANKTRKKVDLVGSNNTNKGGGGGGGQKCDDGDAKQEADKKEDKEGKEQDDKSGGGNVGKGKGGGKDNKKPAVPVIATVVLKIGSFGLHCDGCMHRIRSKLFKIKGVEQVRMDFAKNQVTVVGTMDAKAVPEKLRKKLRRPVDVVPPGKDKDKEKDKDGKQQQGDSKDGCSKEGKDGGKDGKQSKEAAEKAMAAELELWKTAYFDQQALQATQFLLSDENPNACAVM